MGYIYKYLLANCSYSKQTLIDRLCLHVFDQYIIMSSGGYIIVLIDINVISLSNLMVNFIVFLHQNISKLLCH